MMQVKLVVGLYHGSEVLGDVKQTREMTVSNGNCNIDKSSQLTFDLAVQDIQTASRLCFALHGKMKGTRVSFNGFEPCSMKRGLNPIVKSITRCRPGLFVQADRVETVCYL